MITYRDHYAQCLKQNRIEGGKYSSLYDLRVDSELLGTINPGLISKIHQEMCDKIDKDDGCRTESHALRVDSWRDIPEVFTLIEEIMPQVEKHAFVCPAKIEFVHLYRNLPSLRQPENEWDTDFCSSSWKWHYDDCPQEFLKILINLNSVNKDNGCFKYLVNADGDAEIIPSFRTAPGYKARPQVYQSSRIPTNVVESKLTEGWSVVDVTGPPGSYAVCTPNIYHRASSPRIGTSPRDVMFLFVRPSLKISNKYTSTDLDWGGTPEKNVKGYEVD